MTSTCRLIQAIITLFLILAAGKVFAGEAQKLAPRKTVVIFKGATICDGCDDAWADLFTEKHFAVKRVKPGETTPELLKSAAVYVVPGGDDVDHLSDAWSAQEREAIRNYVTSGGHYLGACLGAYWAADWMGTRAGFEPLRLTPAHVWEHDADKSDKIVRVDWQGKTRFVYFQDGPSFNQLAANDKVYARYEDGTVATFLTRFGRGKVMLTGVHVEATQEWLDETKLKDADGLDLDLARQLIDDLFKND